MKRNIIILASIAILAIAIGITVSYFNKKAYEDYERQSDADINKTMQDFTKHMETQTSQIEEALNLEIIYNDAVKAGNKERMDVCAGKIFDIYDQIGDTVSSHKWARIIIQASK